MKEDLTNERVWKQEKGKNIHLINIKPGLNRQKIKGSLGQSKSILTYHIEVCGISYKIP